MLSASNHFSGLPYHIPTKLRQFVVSNWSSFCTDIQTHTETDTAINTALLNVSCTQVI